MKKPKLFKKIHLWLRQDERRIVLLMAGFLGVIVGVVAVLLKKSVYYLHHFTSGYLVEQGYYYFYYISPIVGIALTLYVAKRLGVTSGDHGLTQLMQLISRNFGILPRKQMFANVFTSCLTVGMGGSLGLESPIVVTGSSIGSNLARWAHLAYRYRLTLIGCGAAGAISSIFNSPIAGVLFAVEVVLVDVSIFQFMPVLITSVAGALTSQAILGEEKLFAFTFLDPDNIFALSDTFYYVLLGIFCGLVALHFMRLNFWVENFILKVLPYKFRTLFGGTGLVLLIILSPALYGEGYQTITDLLNEKPHEILNDSLMGVYQAHWLVLLFILLIKPAASALTIGAGGSGGVFAPSMFIGGIGGYLFATLANLILPMLGVTDTLNSSACMLAGMCGVISGLFHAPLTAIFLIAEITDTYAMFIPLMLTAAMSYITLSWFEKYSFYAKHAVESGRLSPPDNRDQRILSNISWESIIETDLIKVRPEKTLKELVLAIQSSKRNVFPVVNEEEVLVGVVTLDNIRHVMFDRKQQKKLKVREFMHTPPATLSLGESMHGVMEKFETTQAWNLPVQKDNKYYGFVSKSRIFNQYRYNILQSQEKTSTK